MDYKSGVKSLTCQWENCGATIGIDLNSYAFSDHISTHLPNVSVTNISGEEVYKCCWDNCIFTSMKDTETIQHILGHAYLSRLKAYAQEYSRLNDLPECLLAPNKKDYLPTAPLQCLWDECDQVFKCRERFISHVDYYHAQNIPLNYTSQYPCLWRGCQVQVCRPGKMRDHLKVHSGDKVLACPTCGQAFNQLCNYSNHCWKQQPVFDDKYQCCHCLNFFATETLLRVHIRLHVNLYKCNICKLTCRTPASLSKHIRYRHLDIRPFKCNHCPKAMKSQYDLEKHQESHKMAAYLCDEDDCDFVARSESALTAHTKRVHRGKVPARFACHLCDKEFSTGRILTRHLLNRHNLHKPKGFSRFLYRLEPDGKKRLQLTRLESGDIAEEEAPVVSASSQTSNSSWKDETEYADEMELSGEEITSTIVIEEVDDKGNVIRST